MGGRSRGEDEKFFLSAGDGDVKEEVGVEFSGLFGFVEDFVEVAVVVGGGKLIIVDLEEDDDVGFETFAFMDGGKGEIVGV